MMVWLRERETGQIEVGIEEDLVPARAYAQLVDIDEARLATSAQCDAHLIEAKAHARSLVEQAEQHATAMLAQATQAFDTASARGVQQGREEALEQWWAEAGGALELRQAVGMSTRDHVAGLVVEAVSRIVRTSAPADLFARACETVERIIGERATITVHVNADECSAAQDAFGALARQWQALGRPISVTVTPSHDLPPGACICQTEVGTVDASVEVQLRALTRLVQRSLGHQE